MAWKATSGTAATVLFFLSAVFEVTAGEGETRCFEPGSVLLMEDTTGTGHTAKVAGTKNALSVVVQLPE
jgi:hypothetical protein